MIINRLLIANRGEIAIRIARAAAELGIQSVAIFAEDDAQCLHIRKTDEALALRGIGAKAYLDGRQILNLAKDNGCDAIHTGYGFLSENADFASQCEAENIIFVGPDADTLKLFGDKASARELAQACNIPLSMGTQGATSLAEVEEFFEALPQGGAVMIKAIAGGGGRGMRPVFAKQELAQAYERCQSESTAAFGTGELYVEQLVRHARHIEVQVIGDGQGSVAQLGERECSLQRRHQKVIEIAPSPSIGNSMREQLFGAALMLAKRANYRGLGTFEFLVDCDHDAFFFIEANPRVQVEHTVTETVTGVDLVVAQLQIAAGASLASINLTQDKIPSAKGYAIQLRINMEKVNETGDVTPTGGTLTSYDLPSGPGIRVDGFGYNGYTTSPHYDSLLAKLIIHSHSQDYSTAVQKAERTLRECHIGGVETNIPLLSQLLKTPAIEQNTIYTRYLDENLAQLITSEQQASHSPLYFETNTLSSVATQLHNSELAAPENCQVVRANMQSVMVDVLVKEEEQVNAGQALAVIEAMKMEHVITAGFGGVIRRIDQHTGDGLQQGQAILYIEPLADLQEHVAEKEVIDLEKIRPDLQELFDRNAKLYDEARPKAIKKRHANGQRSARENIADLVDDDSFMEYGALAVAAQRSRRTLDDLQANTPADGLVCGLATVNQSLFDNDEKKTRCAILSYDYTVLAGTQGYYNHHKTDRILDIVKEQKIPMVFFCEGGGGRPGDVDYPHMTGLTVPSFTTMATLSGLVPTVGIVSGYCFAGNAAFLGCHDVIIATHNASIGMAGPAMIEGGGLGTYRPEEIGPAAMHAKSGAIDILVEDEAQAVAMAKQYLSYFQGTVEHWECTDQRILRHRIPENRLRSYDVRQIIEDLADIDSVLELRSEFGHGIITVMAKIEGRPVGILANNSLHLGGAIDSDAADKGARFIQLCNAFDLPVISLLDTPGFMVGPKAEKTAQIRHFSRLFVAAANADIPIFTVCLRKGYGLGAQAIAAGSFHDPMFTISWPTGEFGPMGLEGMVRLGYRKELAAVSSPEEEKILFDEKLAALYETGKAVNAASTLDLDAVIDPAETRSWLVRGLKYSKPVTPRTGKKVPFIDRW
jgi:acetyl/propionyl-CoA carboxylase alpha subunit/acetyl-CoA carboxylase carboxyltransferase component